MSNYDYFRTIARQSPTTVPYEWSGGFLGGGNGGHLSYSHHGSHSSPMNLHCDDGFYGETDTEDTPTNSSLRAEKSDSSDSLRPRACFPFPIDERLSLSSLDSLDSHAFPAASLEPKASSMCYSMPAAIPQCSGPQINQPAFKCRQLPCRTYISTGSCPYGDRCVFLHDPNIMSKPVYIKSKKKSKEDQTIDAFFWPTMSLSSVMGKVDSKNLPVVSQPYIVPTPNSCGPASSNNDMAVYSMWEHFLDFLKVDRLSVITTPRSVYSHNNYVKYNHHTGRPRLPVFYHLSRGKRDALICYPRTHSPPL